MSEPTTPPADGVNNGNPPAGANPPQPPTGGDTPSNAVPYDRFKEVNDKKNELESRLKAIEEAQKAAEEAKLAEQGEYKTLLEQKNAELEAASAKASEWDSYQTAKKDKILESMSEAQAEKYRGLDLKTLEGIAEDLKLNDVGGKAPGDRPGNMQNGKKFDGHDSLPAWAAHASKVGGKELERYRNRNGDYPR